MLVIRMQRTGRKGHAQFRVVVQDSRRTPTSGKIVAALGSYNPHTKTAQLDKEKAAHYLEHGAQPSERVTKLLTAEGVKLPKWVTPATKKTSAVRNSDKLRRNRPPEPVEEAAPEEPAAEAEVAEEAATEPVAEASEKVAAEAEAPAAEAEPAEAPVEPAAEETAADTDKK